MSEQRYYQDVRKGDEVTPFVKEPTTDWVGQQGTLRKLSCSYKGMNYPGEAVTLRGKVLRKYIRGGEHFVECSLWAENPKGEKTASGAATVVLPSKEDKKRKGKTRR
jgi:hypothetical protein